MVKTQVKIVNSRGLHARPAAKLAKLAAAYDSTITIYKGKRKADAKSITALLMLAASVGTELKIIANGADEKDAANALMELVISGFSDDTVPNNPQQPEAAPEDTGGGRQVHKISGIGIGDTVVSGRAHIHSASAADVPRYRIRKAQVAIEIKRYEKAIAQVREECEATRRETAELPMAAEIQPFIDLHLRLLEDEEFSHKPQKLMRKRLINAEWALRERVEIIGDNFRRLKDAYLRERQHDIEQVMNRLLTAMENNPHRRHTQIATGENALLVASDLNLNDVMHLKKVGYKGFITESGGANSHMAIWARSLNIPALIGARGVLSCLHHNDLVLLDTCKEVVVVNPSASDVKKHKQAEKKKTNVRRRAKSSGKGVSTKDGERVYLNTNIELADEALSTCHSGSDGIGLFRTEFLFMHRADLPSEDEQFETYRSVLEAMKPLPVVIRTLDLGGDKMPSVSEMVPAAANPALGLRAIRYCLAQPELFMTQLRALLRAAAVHDNLRILFPMLTHPQELDLTVSMLAAAREQLRLTDGIEMPSPPLGAMIEVPAAVFIMRALAKNLSFFSIGTNDLMQYTMAVDRNDENLTSLCDPLHPAMLKMLELIVANAKRANLPVTLCGELAGDAELTPLILGLGLRRLSMMSMAVDAVRERLQEADCNACVRLARHVMRAPAPDAAWELLRAANGG